MCTIAGPIQVRPSLQWRTRPRFRPVSLNLTQHNGPQHNDARRNELNCDALHNWTSLKCHYTEFHNTEYCCAECRYDGCCCAECNCADYPSCRMTKDDF